MDKYSQGLQDGYDGPYIVITKDGLPMSDDDVQEDLEGMQAEIKQLEADRDKWKDLYTDLHTLHAEGKIDNSEKLIKENQEFQEALKEIRDKEGRVCPNYEICEHESCRSSYTSWAIATKALEEK
jgi:hypothetical protein